MSPEFLQFTELVMASRENAVFPFTIALFCPLSNFWHWLLAISEIHGDEKQSRLIGRYKKLYIIGLPHFCHKAVTNTVRGNDTSGREWKQILMLIQVQRTPHQQAQCILSHKTLSRIFVSISSIGFWSLLSCVTLFEIGYFVKHDSWFSIIAGHRQTFIGTCYVRVSDRMHCHC